MEPSKLRPDAGIRQNQGANLAGGVRSGTKGGEAADRVTDAQVATVRAALGSDKGAFEIIMCASIGAGLARWDAAITAIEEATDASA